MTAIVIPPKPWQFLKRLLEAGETGQITLNVLNGRIESWDLREHGRHVTGREQKNALDNAEFSVIPYQ